MKNKLYFKRLPTKILKPTKNLNKFIYTRTIFGDFSRTILKSCEDTKYLILEAPDLTNFKLHPIT